MATFMSRYDIGDSVFIRSNAEAIGMFASTIRGIEIEQKEDRYSDPSFRYLADNGRWYPEKAVMDRSQAMAHLTAKHAAETIKLFG